LIRNPRARFVEKVPKCRMFSDLAYSLVFLAGMPAELIVRELRIKPHVMLLWWKIHSIVQSTNPKAVIAFSYDRNEFMCVSAIFGDDIT